MLVSNDEGLRILHQILVKARFRARDGARQEELAAILDHAETLLTYILAEDDVSELFEEQLRALGEEFPQFAGTANSYQSHTV